MTNEGITMTELRELSEGIVQGMPNRNAIGTINNILEGLGLEKAMVCGDQAVYLAAALEMQGVDAVVVNGERGPGGVSTHSWVEVNLDGYVVEIDPWASGFDANNRENYRVTDTWDVTRKDANSILEEFWRKAEIDKSQEMLADLVPDDVMASLQSHDIHLTEENALQTSVAVSQELTRSNDIGLG